MKNNWQEDAKCVNLDTNIFFDKYEEDYNLRLAVDKMCSTCPVRKECIAYAVSRQEWGVWGGVYLEKGKISKEFNDHKDNSDWFNVWSGLTMDRS
jgi:hypothetical protein